MANDIKQTIPNSVKTHILDNGMRVVFDQNKHLNTVAVGVWIGVGSRDENPDNNGISHMIEHMLFKGTETMTAKELAVKTAIIGGGLNAYTSKENTEFSCKTLPGCLKEAIDILGDMICHSKLDTDDLEREKGVVCEEIDMYKDSPEDSVHEILQKKIWKNEPLGYLISGKKKNVRYYTSKQLRDFMEMYYTAENIVVSVAGNFKEKETLKWIEQAFCDVRKQSGDVKIPPRVTPIYRKTEFLKKRDIEQLHMNLAFEAPSFKDKSRYASVIFNAIFGGDVNSRLFQEIREKNGLTYSVYSYGSMFSDTGLLHIYAAMNEHQKDRVYNLIMEIIEDMRRNGVKKDELENAKKQTMVEMALGRDSTVSIMSANAKNIICDLPFYTFEERISNIEKVNAKSVNEYIEKYLNIDTVSMGIIGAL